MLSFSQLCLPVVHEENIEVTRNCSELWGVTVTESFEPFDVEYFDPCSELLLGANRPTGIPGTFMALSGPTPPSLLLASLLWLTMVTEVQIRFAVASSCSFTPCCGEAILGECGVELS